MTKYLILALLVLAFIHCVSSRAYSKDHRVPPMDLVVLVDNSGSMIKGDPEFLSRKLVSNLLNRLSGDDRISFVVFDESFQIAMPLIHFVGEEAREKVSEAVSKVDYRGQYTNIPAAIEKAIYELRENGRKDAKKLIILMSDGVIDVGDRVRDMEQLRWLREDLSLESKEAGIRIFGITFTDQANFETIQTLCQKSEGGYYRALKAGDVQEILIRINAAIMKPKPEPITEIVTATEKGFPMQLLLIVAIVGIVALSVITARTLLAQSIASRKESIPEAYLLDINGITDEGTHKTDKRFFTIGRSKANGIDMSIDRDTVSALQAQIEYRNHSFYLTDMDSKNGTFLNEGKDRIDEVRLKSGDVIIFDQYKFKFVVPGQDEWGGTKLSQLSGETVLSVPGASEQLSPVEKEKAEHKPSMCPEHPSLEATEVCPVCRRTLCVHCMMERDGKKICRRCIDIYFTPKRS